MTEINIQRILNHVDDDGYDGASEAKKLNQLLILIILIIKSNDVFTSLNCLDCSTTNFILSYLKHYAIMKPIEIGNIFLSTFNILLA